ncbi:MAG: serine/threonine protein kinase, partial [Deltaproteobacteria bacterium]|nr:serine/threonine protein kinase [Deltaproteobacteria bacterium]
MSELMPQPDDVVGNFRIVRQIGKGGMGAVFEALDLQTSKSVAIKVLHARFSGDPEALARFLNEGRAMAAVSHPGIVRVLGTGQLGESGACYIAMEYLRGETLGVRLKRSGRLRREALLIGKQIADALVAAHKKNIIHRDLKPSNIILVDGDEDAAGHDNVKIIDFGIAKLPVDEQQEQDFRTRTGTMIGTPVYMAPEQCRGVTVTDRTDVYALGVILYQAMAGKPPFFSQADGDILAMHILVPPRPLKEVEPTVPAPVSTLIGRMLEKNGADRPSISEVASELARLAETPDWTEEPPASATTPAIPLTPIAQLPSTVDQFTDLRLSSQPTPSALGSGVSGQQRTGTSFTRARQTLALLLAFGSLPSHLSGRCGCARRKSRSLCPVRRPNVHRNYLWCSPSRWLWCRRQKCRRRPLHQSPSSKRRRAGRFKASRRGRRCFCPTALRSARLRGSTSSRSSLALRP